MSAEIDRITRESREMERVMRGGPRHTPTTIQEAYAIGKQEYVELAMQEVDRAVDQAAREVRSCAHAIRHIGCPSCDEQHAAAVARETEALDAALSNAALGDTPAVREMGGPARDLGPLPRMEQVIGIPIRGETPPLPPDAIVLTGSEAEIYRAIQAAARKAHESARALKADSAALTQLFQQFCSGLAPGKEP